MAKKILVVDDEPDIRKLLEFRLRKAGYDVVGVSDGYRALKKVEEERPDLIVLDVIMPELNGFEVCEILKGNDKTKDIPVIMLTVLAKEIDLSRGLERGASTFISKPFNVIDLLWEVKAFLKEKPKKTGKKSKVKGKIPDDIISIKVIPNAKRNEIKKEAGGLKVRLTAPAVEGKANKLLITLLSDYFKCRKSEVKIIKGEKSKNKIVQVKRK